jgi:hypothetical protein
VGLPRIDVLLPVRCARRTLPFALADMLAQERVDVRVVAVVDERSAGGDDGSAAWLTEQARSEPRLIAMPGPGRGPGAALDRGLTTVTTPPAALIALMEADDRCPPDRLRRLYDPLQLHPHLMGVVSRAGQIGRRTPGMRRYLDWQNGLITGTEMAAERFVEIPALFQTGLYRRQALWATGGFEPRGDWPIDIAFWFRWFAIELPVAKVPRVLYRWRQHAGQSTRTDAQHEAAALRACKVDALVQLLGRNSLQPRPVRLVSVGETLAAWQRDLEAANIELVDAVSWKPGRPAPEWPTDLTLPGVAVRWGPPLLLAAYGMPRTRDALREALGHPLEPGVLLFTA